MAIKKVIKKSLKGYKESLRVETLKLSGYTYKKKHMQPIVFILSTGRCGSTSIKQIFNQHPKFLAFHEDIKELINLSTELAERPKKQDLIFKELDRLFANKFWEAQKNQIIVHSDHRMWNLVPYLSNYFPNSFFIHLIRNPLDSIKSYIQRNWYLDTLIENSDSLFQKYRLQGDKVKAVNKLEWGNFSQIEKCLWYWNFVNTTIDDDLKVLNNERYGVIRLEDFILDINMVIRKNYEIDEDFHFREIKINTSKKKIDSSILIEDIKNALKENREHLFLDYYPNLKF